MRVPDTYRSARRNVWRAIRRFHGDFPWVHFNTSAPRYHLGTLPAEHRPDHVARSKYMPHIGKKERGRHAPKLQAAA